MDFPIFHLDFIGDRFLIAVIAIIHVIINHGLAVGLVPIVLAMELKGLRDPAWDRLAYKIMTVAFILTTTVGAMSGVGIWFASSLINLYSIGSLIRVFYGAWFVEWTVFVTEVVLIMVYYLTWKRTYHSERENVIGKFRHIITGWGLAAFSWITMAIIVSILGFMMDPGNWNNHKTFWNGFGNPMYLPQLVFRTFLATVIGAVVSLSLTMFFTERGSDIRAKATRFLSGWILIFAPLALLGGLWYYRVIPNGMINNMSVAVGTQQFQEYYEILRWLLVGGVGVVLILAAAHYFWRRLQLPRLAYLVPVFLMFGVLGFFERVREFIRKPYVIGGYMYSNTFRVEEYPLLKRDGMLAHATYVSTREVTPVNQLEAGQNVFLLACSRCHTTNGVNSIVDKFNNLYGNTGNEWAAGAMKAYIRNMHNSRYYMPPFPGNEAELDALIAYIKTQQFTPSPAEGVQVTGLNLPPTVSTNSGVATGQTFTSKPAGVPVP